MDEIDRKLLAQAEKGLTLTSQPFDQIATNLGIPTEEVIQRLRALQKNGVIRRFGASVTPNGVGYSANAMVAWKVPPNRVTEVSGYFCKRREVSHCYEREVVPGEWEYNFYTVIHAQERSAVEKLVKLFAAEAVLSDYAILFSTRNLKLKEKTKC